MKVVVSFGIYLGVIMGAVTAILILEELSKFSVLLCGVGIGSSAMVSAFLLSEHTSSIVNN